MITKKQRIIIYSALALVFISLLLVATFFDYQITDFLAKDGLAGGLYYSTNGFGRFFEIFGEQPVYLIGSFAAAIFAFRFKEMKHKIWRYVLFALFLIGSVVLGYVCGDSIFDYLSKLHPEVEFFDSIFSKIIAVVFGLVVCLTMALVTMKLMKKVDIKTLFRFAFFIAIAIAVSQTLVQLLKIPAGRERYKTLSYLGGLSIESQGFTPWYVFNGSSSKIAESFDPALGITSDFFKSFPSGHTCSAAVSLVFAFVPFFFDKVKGKAKVSLCIAIPAIYVVTVAISRLVMGAHFLSDVLVGGTATLLCCIGSFYLTNFLFKKFAKK